MRKMKMVGLAMIFLTFLVGTACQKEEIQQESNKSEKGLIAKAGPGIALTPTVTWSCGQAAPCLFGVYTTSKYNCVTTTKDALTILNHPNLRYTYYVYTSTDAVTGYKNFIPVGQFICNANTVSFGDPLLPNNTEVYVLANIPTGTAPSGVLKVLGSAVMNLNPAYLESRGVLVTTGNYKGQSCPGGVRN